MKSAIPNPYAASSESEEEIEADLEEVATIRRSLVRPRPTQPQSERAKKGWLAHQSVFPNSSSSSDSESEKQTESESEDERSRMMGRSRQKARHVEEETELSPSEVLGDRNRDMEEPLLGPDELDARGQVSIPNRLQVYHGRFGHWEREGLRKYKGEFGGYVADVDSGFLALWLASILGVVIALCFVWGSTEVSEQLDQLTLAAGRITIS